MKHFSLIIKKTRKEKGYTLSELARRANVSKAHLSQIESGKIKDPSVFTTLRLASILGVDIEDLVGEWGFSSVEIVKKIKSKIITNPTQQDQ